ncbi:amidoligase family protein [Azospirillum halopraeferens]|uniref:amidoligase family protein n=1 Tax=Azospirillum halopraeferens TaxID=34010 RepID=UPI0004086B16|nr:amidoligase family protein [Azospirillum halopraeferens]
MDTTLRMPPRRTAPDGSPRRVGVELEFANLDAPAAARTVRSLYGGTVASENPHRCRVFGTRLGDFAVELDMQAAHKKPDAPPAMPDTLDAALDAVLDRLRPLWGSIGSLVMPFEIAAPPIPMERLGELDALVHALRAAGAAGTEASPLFAFGLHFNPEVADTGADYVLDHLKAFLLLGPWLRAGIRVDPTRRLSGFVAAFPADYAATVVDPAYRPDLPGLVADYLDANPTRNRELDLFPLFAHLAPEVLFARVSDPHVRARPTFHYRLPNARIGDPRWSLVTEWNRWVVVEELAADRERLDGLGRDYRRHAAEGRLAGWAAETGRRLASPAG